MAAAELAAPEPKKGPSLVVQIGVLAVLTLVAAGTGWFSGASLGSGGTAEPVEDHAAAPASDAGGHGEAKPTEAGEEGETPILRPGVLQLQPITTNLTAPSNVWIRMEIAVVFEGDADAAVADAIHQDLMAYVRTLSLPQIEGASGFQHLRADLEERAAIRSEGRVKKILIRTLLFE